MGWAVAVLGFLYYASPMAIPLFNPHRQFSVFLAVLLLVSGSAGLALLRWLHRNPLAVTVTLAGLWCLSPTVFGPALAAQSYLARFGKRNETIGGAAALIAAKTLSLIVPGSGSGPGIQVEWTISVSGIVIAGLVGWLRQSRDETAWRRAEAEAARQDAWEARVNEARLAERERIAREMHDVVAHRISLIALHAGALAYRMSGSGREEADLAQMIQANAQSSLDELRTMLVNLRGSDAPPEPPQPTLADLDGLLSEARSAGQRVDASLGGDLAQVASHVSRHGYRIVQEALTNARKHAPGAPVHLSVAAGDDGVRILVDNPVTDLAAPNRSGSGLGLVGVVERVEQVGGEVTHGEDEGRFILSVFLPDPPKEAHDSHRGGR